MQPPPSPEKKIVEELNSHGKVPSLSPAQENDFFKKMPKDPFSGKQLLFGPPPPSPFPGNFPVSMHNINNIHCNYCLFVTPVLWHKLQAIHYKSVLQ